MSNIKIKKFPQIIIFNSNFFNVELLNFILKSIFNINTEENVVKTYDGNQTVKKYTKYE
jgi:hypothetical protein